MFGSSAPFGAQHDRLVPPETSSAASASYEWFNDANKQAYENGEHIWPTNKADYSSNLMMQDAAQAYDWKKMQEQQKYQDEYIDRQMAALARNGVNPYYLFGGSTGASGTAPSGGSSSSASMSGKSPAGTIAALGAALVKLIVSVAAAV